MSSSYGSDTRFEVVSQPGFEEFKQFVAKKKPTGVAQLLELMSQDYDFRSYTDNSVVQFSSESLHNEFINEKTPRLILYSPGSRLLMAVATHSRHPHHEAIELLEQQSSGYRAYLMKKNKKSEFEFLEWKPNGTLNCHDCHGSPPRPIFGPYAIWPGSFGGIRGGATTKDERLKIKNFCTNITKLPNLKKIKHVFIKLCNDKRDASTEEFSDKLATLMFETMRQKLSNSNAWPAIKYAVLGAGMSCENFTEFFPADFKNLKTDLDRLLKLTSDNVDKYYDQLKKDYFKLHGSYPSTNTGYDRASPNGKDYYSRGLSESTNFSRFVSPKFARLQLIFQKQRFDSSLSVSQFSVYRESSKNSYAFGLAGTIDDFFQGFLCDKDEDLQEVCQPVEDYLQGEIFSLEANRYSYEFNRKHKLKGEQHFKKGYENVKRLVLRECKKLAPISRKAWATALKKPKEN